MEKRSLRWTAPEYYHTEKSVDWYWAVGLIGLVVAVISIVFGDILFGIFFIIAVSVLMLYAARPPKIISCEISERGVIVESLLYPFKELESYWISDLPHHPKILIHPRRRFAPMVIVPLGEQPAEDVRPLLEEHLVEAPHHEPVTLRLMEYFGF
jgi:hypothetical protein